ncbi:MAG: hypothetical protein AAGA30_05960 [Planctomycetota bacterium]
MEEKQLLKLMTASIAAPMIQNAITAEMNHVELGGDGKIQDTTLEKIRQLAEWYAQKILAAQ